MQNPLQIPLYHITHIDNLQSILAVEGLWCDRERMQQGLDSVNIAHKKLKERRMNTPVPFYNNKTLGDFVPFYFENRTPMLLSIHNGFVDGYSGDQTTVIYLQTTIGTLINNTGNWCFTDGHAAEAFSEFYNDLNDLDNIDWDLIKSWSWKNTLEDNDRKRRKQAEFLVESFVPLSAIIKIAVFDDNKLRTVREILEGVSYAPETVVKSNWYYN